MKEVLQALGVTASRSPSGTACLIVVSLRVIFGATMHSIRPFIRVNNSFYFNCMRRHF